MRACARTHECDRADVAAWQQESGELKRKLSLLEQQTPLQAGCVDGQGGGASSVEEAMRRATEAEYEKALLERQVGSCLCACVLECVRVCTCMCVCVCVCVCVQYVQ